MHIITSLEDPALAKFIAHPDKDIELFAGPGGFSEGRTLAGAPHRTALGIEYDQAACETATAAGHPRLLWDIAKLDPLRFGAVRGIHSSPPCPGFSAAGKGLGRRDLDMLAEAAESMANYPEPWYIEEVMAWVRTNQADPRSALSLEPLRWILLLQPEWWSLEQVKEVLPLWEIYAKTLGTHGYSVWSGKVSSEQYGVPQTRVRAIAYGSRVRKVGPMVPTHSKFYPRDKARRDPGVLDFVTMREAMGWAADTRVVSNYGTGGDPAARGERTADEPAATVTSKAGRNRVVHGARVLNSGPKPTASMDNGNFRWVPEAANEGTIEADMEWAGERPSPTIVSSFAADVVAAPGWRKPGDGPRQKAKGSIRVTVQEAGILQSFPPDYPWKGTKTKQHEQVGNAVPPLLGKAMYETVNGLR